MEELQGKYYSLLRGFDHVVDVVKEADDARKQPIINTARQNLLACVQSVRAKAKRSRNIFENISDTEDCIIVEPSTSKWYFFINYQKSYKIGLHGKDVRSCYSNEY